MGRFRSRQPSEPLDGGESCPLCGVRVPVGADGRCRLGHRVRAAGTATPALLPVDAQAPAAEMEEGIAEFLAEDRAEVAQPVADAQADAGAAPQDPAVAPEPEPSSPPPAAVSAPPGDTPPREQAAPWHPYDEVLAAGPLALGPGLLQGVAGPTPVPAPQAPTGGDTRSALEDLLSWDEPMQSALDMSVEEPPVPATEPDIDAACAPATAETGLETQTQTSAADEGTARETGETPDRRLTVLVGSGALAIFALAALALAATL